MNTYNSSRWRWDNTIFMIQSVDCGGGVPRKNGQRVAGRSIGSSRGGLVFVHENDLVRHHL